MKNLIKLSNLLIIGSLSILPALILNFYQQITASAPSGEMEQLLSLFNDRSVTPLRTTDILYYISSAALSVAGILFALGFRKNDEEKTKLSGIFFLTAAAAQIFIFLLNHGSHFLTMIEHSWMQVLTSLLIIAATVLIGLSLFQKEQNKIKQSWIILIYGGVLLSIEGEVVARLAMYVTPYSNYAVFEILTGLIRLLAVLSPIAYILMSKYLIEKSETAAGELVPETSEEQFSLLNQKIDWNKTYEPFWWLVTFLFASISIIGTAILIYWAVSKSHTKRAGWATANLCVAAVFSLYYLFNMRYDLIKSFSSKGFLIIIIITILFHTIIIAICLLAYRKNLAASSFEKMPVSLPEWLLYCLLAAIPIVNLITFILFINWKENSHRRNWAIGGLVFFPIWFVSFLNSGWWFFFWQMGRV